MAYKSRSFYSRFSSFEDYQEYRSKDYLRVELPVCESLPVPTFKVSVFPSGELSAAYYLANASKRYIPAPRSISVTTDRLTHKSVQKIRRSAENTQSQWKSFLTLTFNPAESQLNADGTINHAWAKKELIRFRQALSKKVGRQIECKLKEVKPENRDEYRHKNAFRYIWVAELQKNGNIHFHIMLNKYFAAYYLRDLWGQGDAAVDVRTISDSRHAAAYICKYITKEADGRQKESSTINGNRYNISKAAREDAKPMSFHKFDQEAIEAKKLLDLMKTMVDEKGGRVIDSGFGMNIPAPRRSVPYRDKKTGTIKKTRSVCSRLANYYMDAQFGAVPF